MYPDGIPNLLQSSGFKIELVLTLGVIVTSGFSSLSSLSLRGRNTYRYQNIWPKYMCNNVSRVMEFRVWGVLKILNLVQKLRHSKEIVIFCDRPNARASKCAKIILSKSIYYVKNQQNFFHFFHIRVSIYETIFVKNILFSKIMPNFCRLGIRSIHIIHQFPFSMLIFGQNSCFLGPTKVETP